MDPADRQLLMHIARQLDDIQPRVRMLNDWHYQVDRTTALLTEWRGVMDVWRKSADWKLKSVLVSTVFAALWGGLNFAVNLYRALFMGS